MLAALGIVLLVAGAIVLFAIDWSADGVDLVAIGWILMGGGGLSLLVAMIQGAGSVSEQRTVVGKHVVGEHVVDSDASGDGRHVDELVGADGFRPRRSS
ncbi:MAG TPA: DUF6458 family protein [Ilumatobacter sp.]|jgi:hypothetical protein|nr:DUF6458 family protein [Ilumatobacter sp.]